MTSREKNRAVQEAVKLLTDSPGALSQVGKLQLGWLRLAVEREEAARELRDQTSLRGIYRSKARKAQRVRAAQARRALPRRAKRDVADVQAAAFLHMLGEA